MDWKNTSALTSQVLLLCLDCRVKKFCEQLKSVDPSCVVSTVQVVGGVKFSGIFSLRTGFLNMTMKSL